MTVHDSRGHNLSTILTEQLKDIDLLVSLVHFNFTLEAILVTHFLSSLFCFYFTLWLGG